MIPQNRYSARREKLKRVLKKEKLPAFLVCNETNVSYLTGFSGDSSWFLIGKDFEILISDGRYTTQISEECPGIQAEIRPVNKTLLQTTAEVLKASKEPICGFESTAISYDAAGQLVEAVETPDLIPVKGLVEPLRAVKDADEVKQVREAVRQAEKGFEFLKSSLMLEMTELQAAFTLEEGIRRFGAIGAGFEIITAVGERAALPHARPGLTRCEESPFMLVDWGARTSTGYVSDLTRMIVTGSISSKLQRMYEVVKTALEESIQAIGPDVRASDVDRVARQVMENHGVAAKFNHGLGHGFGLQVHESVRMSPTSEDVFKPGMVVTVEPGLYFPGWGGIRIEDDVLITKDGCEVLSSLSRELEAHTVG